MRKRCIIFTISLLFVAISSVSGQDKANKVQVVYEGCFEMPAMNCGTSSTFIETYGESTGFKHTVVDNPNQTVVNHTIDDNGVKRNYTMLYDKTKFGALWVAYIMHKGYHADNDVGRKGKWTNDPAIPKDDQQTGAGYGKRGYSRGHQTASNDRQDTEASNKQTFYNTNILPQWQNSFNGGIWNDLENEVQKMAPERGVTDTIYVVTGPIYKDNTEEPIVAGGRVIDIASHYFKAIIKCKFDGTKMISAQGIGFYYENKEHKGASFSDAKYIRSIDWIEEQSGFDLFANLPETIERSVETNADYTAFINF